MDISEEAGPVIPLEFVKGHIEIVREDLTADEDGLYALSTAVEHFVRYLTNSCLKLAGGEGITYDNIADFIQSSHLTTLKDFFPRRVEFQKISMKIAEAENDEDENDYDANESMDS